MGVISPDNSNLFKSSSYLFSKIKRDLRSYSSGNLIDDGEFPTYVKEVLRGLGIGVYKEEDAAMRVENFKALLPDDFSVLYAAYKCTPSFSQKDRVHPQGGISVYNDVTWELLQSGKNCEIDCVTAGGGRTIEKITVRQYVKEESTGPVSLVNPILLRLSPNVKPEKCDKDCMNLLASSPYEITFKDKHILANFSDDFIYMKYYAFPVDESGLPEIPDIEEVEKTIEWYIKYQLLLGWWMNNEVPDLQNRWQYAEAKYEEYRMAAKNYLKTPSFASMVNYARRQRGSNKIRIFT